MTATTPPQKPDVPDSPRLSPRAEAEAAARRAREAEALRENLRRRKLQQRARAQDAATTAKDEPCR